MYTLYKFHFLNGISEINQLFYDILIIWPAPVYIDKHKHVQHYLKQKWILTSAAWQSLPAQGYGLISLIQLLKLEILWTVLQTTTI